MATANTATTQAIEAANVAVQAAQSAQVSASQAATAASQGTNVTNITVINPNAAGIVGAVQFASSSNQLSASRNLVFDQSTSNLQLIGNLSVDKTIKAGTLEFKNAIVSGDIQVGTITAARVESLANISVANRITANVISANVFVGDGSQLTGILLQDNATLTGNVTIPNIDLTGPLLSPVPLGLLIDSLEPKANINSPNFTGNPTAPTLTNASTSTDSIATTAFVQLVANTKANTTNVTLTDVSLIGNVFAPTQIANTNDDTVATTKFVQDQKINLNLSGIPTAPIPNTNAVANQIATVSFARSSGAPSIILSRRIGTNVAFSVGNWVTIPFETLDRNIAGLTIAGDNFDLLPGTYVYNISIPVHSTGSGTITGFYTRFLNVDTGFVLQTISATSIGDLSTASITGTGQFTLSGTTTIALQGLQTDGPTARIDGYSGYQSGVIQFWKVA